MTIKDAKDTIPGLVLSGGGARGAFQVGVWRHLRNDPIFKDKPVILSGTSAGAINSAFIAAGKDPDDMMAFWESLTINPPVQVSNIFMQTLVGSLTKLFTREPAQWFERGRQELEVWWTRIQNHFPFKTGSPLAVVVEHLLASRWDIVSEILDGIKEPYLADISRFHERLVEAFGDEVIHTGDNRLAINAVEVETGSVIRFINYDPGEKLNDHYKIVPEITVDMVMASAAIPLLFSPVNVNGQQLWDGGLLVNTPLAPCVAMGADEIVSVLVTKGPQEGLKLNSFGEAVERVADAFLENSYNLDRMLLLERNRLAGIPEMKYKHVKLYREIRPKATQAFSAGSYLYFNRRMLREMHDQGVQAMLEWQTEGKHEDHLHPFSGKVGA